MSHSSVWTLGGDIKAFMSHSSVYLILCLAICTLKGDIEVCTFIGYIKVCAFSYDVKFLISKFVHVVVILMYK